MGASAKLLTVEFAEVVRKRRMVRCYDPNRAVPSDAMEAMLDAATRAPSAGFSQGWDFVILTERADRERFWAATTKPAAEQDQWLTGLRTAPCLIICCSDKQAYLDRYAAPDKGWTDRDEARWPIPYWDVDTGMASLLLLLTAVDWGLAGLFFGVPAAMANDVRSEFAIPAERRLVGVVAVGYGASDRKSPSLRRGRRGVDQIAHWGRFGTTRAASTSTKAGTQPN